MTRILALIVVAALMIGLGCKGKDSAQESNESLPPVDPNATPPKMANDGIGKKKLPPTEGAPKAIRD